MLAETASDVVIFAVHVGRDHAAKRHVLRAWSDGYEPPAREQDRIQPAQGQTWLRTQHAGGWIETQYAVGSRRVGDKVGRACREGCIAVGPSQPAGKVGVATGLSKPLSLPLSARNDGMASPPGESLQSVHVMHGEGFRAGRTSTQKLLKYYGIRLETQRIMSTPVPERPAKPVVSSTVLFVDLDGTLIHGDLLHESIARLIFRRPLWLAITLMRLAVAPARLKRAIAAVYTPDVTTLPYRQNVLELIDARRDSHRLVLATAGDKTWAQRVADHLGFFDDIVASDGCDNIKGARKLAAIHEWCARHGATRWGYVGDSEIDVAIWREASEAIVVNDSSRLHDAVETLGTNARFVAAPGPALADVGRILRVQQWVKNLLVLVPLPLSQTPPTTGMIVKGILAFLAFCLAASGIYIINDLVDLDADRAHPSKRFRPFAAGRFPMLFGPPLAAGLLATACGLAYAVVSGGFGILLAIYLAATVAYSLLLKRLAVVDVMVLASLYMLRIIAGGVATGVPISEWLLAFSMFFFFSLALTKRHSELLRLMGKSTGVAAGRGYLASDAPVIQTLGIVSGMISVLVFALFAHSPETRQLYANSFALWFACPLLTLWLGRVWLFSARGTLSEDPVMFAVRDGVSIVMGVLMLACVLYARGGGLPRLPT
jgi:4-hydroxybenzoate polyprenyltransferase/phosphoserine phosphatase